MRYLAIDFGGKRTGLAVGDDGTCLSGPVGMIEAADMARVVEAVVEAIEEHGAEALVLGVPFNMDGTKGPAAEKAFKFADELKRRTGLEVHLVDERLTSFEADETMKGIGLTRGQKKARRDALAAAAILRDFLEGLKRNSPSGP